MACQICTLVARQFINGDGAKTVIMAALSPAEQMQMQRSVEILRAVTADALANFMK